MTEILDSEGNTITVGARVLDDDGNPEGTVTHITEPDGDVNDYGRPVAYGPFVWVRYDDSVPTGDVRYTATWNATGPWDDQRDDYTCDDLTVAVADPTRCRYSDCTEAHPIAADNEQVTCPTCRAYMGLPPATDDQIDRSFDAYR